MSLTGLDAFDRTLQKTNEWLNEIMDEQGWSDRQRAYLALRATLHALRDQLTAEEAVHLGAQMPMLVRGFYYEGWHPASREILRERHKGDFLASIEERLRNAVFPDRLTEEDARMIARGVFRVLDRRITAGEIEDVRNMLPKHVRELWPTSSTAEQRQGVRST